MKTAMQELIERLDKTENQLENENNLVMSSALYAARSMALEALEKEKQQSINLIKQTCMFMGASIIDIEISKMEFEDIYNNYYNQNK
jgi:hypothetical protein